MTTTRKTTKLMVRRGAESTQRKDNRQPWILHVTCSMIIHNMVIRTGFRCCCWVRCAASDWQENEWLLEWVSNWRAHSHAYPFGYLVFVLTSPPLSPSPPPPHLRTIAYSDGIGTAPTHPRHASNLPFFAYCHYYLSPTARPTRIIYIDI